MFIRDSTEVWPLLAFYYSFCFLTSLVTESFCKHLTLLGHLHVSVLHKNVYQNIFVDCHTSQCVVWCVILSGCGVNRIRVCVVSSM